jgi:hypothetical protein
MLQIGGSVGAPALRAQVRPPAELDVADATLARTL